MKSGRVYLVGAGPGDPELLTLKGRRALEQADAVLYDHLAAGELLRFAPASAERVYVGKKKADHAMAQDEITRLMIERAQAGLTVVRLKGGDPFLFGRGGEEIEALRAAGVRFEAVPGVTAPLGLAAYTGVPLTHRDHASMLTMVTGHDPDRIDWAVAARAGTLVIFMGLTTLGEIARRLTAAGLDPATPAMAVRWATRPEQQVVRGTVSSLAAQVAEAGMKPPATVVIGTVVALHEQFDWVSARPLAGQRIVVTRAAEQAGELSARLADAGAEAIELPVIGFAAPDDPTPLDRAILGLDRYDWLVLTSTNGVRFFVERMDRLGVDLRRWPARIAAVGAATREAIEALHLRVDVTPERYVAEALVEAFERYEMAGRRVLVARAAVARDVIPEALRARGAEVDVVDAYRTIVPTEAPARAAALFLPGDDAAAGGRRRKPDWVTFTSGSTVKNLVSMVGREALEGVRIASIGPVTSEAARKHGLTVTVEAEPSTMDGLAAAILSAAAPVMRT